MQPQVRSERQAPDGKIGRTGQSEKKKKEVEGVNGQKRVRKEKEESCAGPQTNGEMF